MDYLECAYETKHYIIDKVNGQINAIHDDSLELTEFKGCFSLFDLDELEMKVCRLADRNKYEDDLPESQDPLQAQDSDSNSGSHNSEEMTGMGFDPNYYSPIPPVGNAASQQGATLPTSTPKPVVEANMNTSDPTHNRGKVKIINSFATNQEQVKTMRKPSKGGKVKSSHARSQAQPSTSTQGSTGRPQVQCTACGGADHLRKDCYEDVFCTRCGTRSHVTEMCRVPTKTGMSNTICIYCGSTNHISNRCHNRPNDNREEPRSIPRDLREHGTGNIHKRFRQPQVNHHQTRFNEGLNRQYLPNYNNYHQSPLGSIPGQDLSTTLMELANIQSRSLEMMAASQRSQQEAFQELTRASKDKANDAMFASIKVFDGKNRQAFEDWIDKINQACRVSDRNFRTEIFKKSTGAV